ncbi:hypothetical protein ACTI_63740 [Actinoplanes sp. OR16]|uniref:hypothetical protein n=1 Tax=Actinoplanes sp. OR16 TaxID=946334 RepID=UPI000F719E06|nr:hypothetical protein [Actinoplanes sp. OR16]BBH69689.1 hypothetical protein ACTI_63740 [Actinoplanes sp. OR16]
MTPRRSPRAAVVMLLLVLLAGLLAPAGDAVSPADVAGHSAEFHAEQADGAGHAVLGKRLRPQAVLPPVVVVPTSSSPRPPARRGDHSFRPPTSTGAVLRV